MLQKSRLLFLCANSSPGVYFFVLQARLLLRDLFWVAAEWKPTAHQPLWGTAILRRNRVERL